MKNFLVRERLIFFIMYNLDRASSVSFHMFIVETADWLLFDKYN